jgi:hypothetical protein
LARRKKLVLKTLRKINGKLADEKIYTFERNKIIAKNN